jgi:hypothetical protein
MLKNTRTYPTAILTTLAFIGIVISTNTQAIAQTSSTQSSCTEVEIQKHIQQLNQGEPANFNAVVACKSKAVPSLIKNLNTLDENLRITMIAALGEIGAEASPAVPLITKAKMEAEAKKAVPVLINALQDPNRDFVAHVAYALSRIEDYVRALILALQNPDPQVRAQAADTLGKLNQDKNQKMEQCKKQQKQL